MCFDQHIGSVCEGRDTVEKVRKDKEKERKRENHIFKNQTNTQGYSM